MVTEQRFDPEHSRFRQRAAMIARFFFPLLPTHFPNAPQILVPWQGGLSAIAMLLDFGTLARGMFTCAWGTCSAKI